MIPGTEVISMNDTSFDTGKDIRIRYDVISIAYVMRSMAVLQDESGVFQSCLGLGM